MFQRRVFCWIFRICENKFTKPLELGEDVALKIMGVFSDVAQDHDCRWAAIAKRSCDEGAATFFLCRRFEVSGKVGNPIITPITADLSPEIAALTSEIPTPSFEDLRLERFWRRDWVRNSSIGLTKLDGKEWSICFFLNDMFGVVWAVSFYVSFMHLDFSISIPI